MSTWTYTDPSTDPIAELRLLIDDRDLSSVGDTIPFEKRSAIFSDEEMALFINRNPGSVLYAAAAALRTIASNRSLMVVSRKIGDTEVNYGSLRNDLLKQAEAYKTQADELAGGLMAPADGVAEIGYNDFNTRSIVVERYLRTGGA